MRSMPSGNISAMIFGEMARASIGSRESLSRIASDEKIVGIVVLGAKGCAIPMRARPGICPLKRKR